MTTALRDERAMEPEGFRRVRREWLRGRGVRDTAFTGLWTPRGGVRHWAEDR